MLAELNGLDILSVDAENAYLNFPCMKNIWFTTSHEFGIRKGANVAVLRALCGLKISGAAWRDHLFENMNNIGFLTCEP